MVDAGKRTGRTSKRSRTWSRPQSVRRHRERGRGSFWLWFARWVSRLYAERFEVRVHCVVGRTAGRVAEGGAGEWVERLTIMYPGW